MTQENESPTKNVVDKIGPLEVLVIICIGSIWPFLWGVLGLLAHHWRHAFGLDHRTFAITWVFFLVLPSLFLFAISAWWRRRALVIVALSTGCILCFTQMTCGAASSFYIHIYQEIFTPDRPGLSEWKI
jgi:hypothetical protein